MRVTYFRERIPGPELAIEDAVALSARGLFFSDEELLWSGGSLPVGAGRPDLVLVSYSPEVTALDGGDLAMAQILAYLRAVRKARLDTIAQRMRKGPRLIARSLDALLAIKAITRKNSTYALSPKWRMILPEIVAIEAKVADWHGAASQAKRNRIFAHRSFVALPEKVALRVRCHPVFQNTGIGIVAVEEGGGVIIVRKGSRQTPRVWTYYYQLAIIASQCVGNRSHAVRCSYR